MKEESFVISKRLSNKKDAVLHPSLGVIRPTSIDEFIGQDKILQQISILLACSKNNYSPLPHMIFYGEPGTGKTSLASILGKENGTDTMVLSGPTIDRSSKLIGALMNVSCNQVLFIDEIHALSRPVEEILYSAMEDFMVDLVVDNSNKHKPVRVPIPAFTLVGATTKLSKLTKPLFSRFAVSLHFLPYSEEDLSKILIMEARKLSLNISECAVQEISKRSRASPRQAKHILSWVSSFSKVNNHTIIDQSIVKEAVYILGLDDLGLNETDIRFLKILTENKNKPIGLSTLAAYIGEDQSTIEDVYEPYLIRIGMIKRTKSGRIATEKACRHLNKNPPE